MTRLLRVFAYSKECVGGNRCWPCGGTKRFARSQGGLGVWSRLDVIGWHCPAMYCSIGCVCACVCAWFGPSGLQSVDHCPS